MKGQWGLIFALIFAFIVAIFAVINVGSVTVDYLFGTAQWPLVLVILASALLGALIVGGFGSFRVFRLHREKRNLEKMNQQLQQELQKYTGNTTPEATNETDGGRQDTKNQAVPKQNSKQSKELQQKGDDGRPTTPS